MFVIWKVKRAVSNAEIADEHFNYFRPEKKKSQVTVRGTIRKIKQKESRYGRNYILSSDTPRTHQIANDLSIHPKATVHSEGTAVMLLELKTGYLKTENLTADILREPFEQYIVHKYYWPEVGSEDRLFKDPGDVAARIVKAEASGYLKFTKYGKADGLEAAPRLDHDLRYLLLIVEDYSKEIEDQPPTSGIIADIQGLLSLFGPEHAPSTILKNSKGAY